MAVPDAFSVAKDAVVDVKASAVAGDEFADVVAPLRPEVTGDVVSTAKNVAAASGEEDAVAYRNLARGNRRASRGRTRTRRCSPRARSKPVSGWDGNNTAASVGLTFDFVIRDAHAAASVAPEAVFDRVVGPDEVPAVAEGAGGAIPAPGPGRSAAGMASPPSMAPSPAVTGCGIAPPPIGFRTSRATAAANEAEMVPTAR